MVHLFAHPELAQRVGHGADLLRQGGANEGVPEKAVHLGDLEGGPLRAHLERLLEPRRGGLLADPSALREELAELDVVEPAGDDLVGALLGDRGRSAPGPRRRAGPSLPRAAPRRRACRLVDLAQKLRVEAGHDLQERALSRAVEADNADLGAVEIAEGDVLEDLLRAVDLAHAHHRIDDLVRFVLLRHGP